MKRDGRWLGGTPWGCVLVAALGLCVTEADAQQALDRVNRELTPGVWGRIYEPEGTGPFPAVVLLHGSSGELPEHSQYAAEFADRGYLAVILEYYGESGVRPPNTLEHWTEFQTMLRRAVVYTAGLPTVGDGGIALVGWSRGAVLAIATAPSVSEVDAVVDFYGGICGGSPPGCRGETVEQRRVREAALRDLPPLLILHGDADAALDVAQAYRLHELVSGFGGEVELSVYPGAAHAFDSPGSDRFDAGASRDAWDRVYTFLERHLSR